MPYRHQKSGFTLIEVLAAVLLTSMVIGVAVALYVNLANATRTAAERTREARHAVAIMDRVARDLEAAYLLEKAPEVDPLEHPWIFIAEGRYSAEGADQLKFVTRNHRPTQEDAHVSDVALVSYALVDEGMDDDGVFSIRRWSAPSLPDGLDRGFPAAENENAMTLADGVASFDIRFMRTGGNWQEEWDSSQLQNSGDLPVMAEIRIALADPDSFLPVPEEGPQVYTRRVFLPLRPVPLAQLIQNQVAALAAGEAVDRDGDGKPDKPGGGSPAENCQQTYLQCFDRNASQVRDQFATEQEFQDCRALVATATECVEDYPGRKVCGGILLDCGI